MWSLQSLNQRRSVRTVVWALYLGIGVLGITAQQPASNPDAATKNLEDETDKVFAKFNSTVTPGCALSVMRDGRIIY